MGLKNDYQQKTYLKLKVDKESGKPSFHIVTKEGNGYKTSEPFQNLSGYLKKVEASVYVWEGKNVDTMKFFIDDDEKNDVQFVLEMNFNFMSRNILNTLLGFTGIGHITMNAYLSKKNDAGKQYPNVYIEADGQKGSWKFKQDEIPKVENIKNKKGETVSFDDTEVNEFFKSKIDEINGKLKSEFDQVSKEMGDKNPNSKTDLQKASDESIANDDNLGLPF